MYCIRAQNPGEALLTCARAAAGWLKAAASIVCSGTHAAFPPPAAVALRHASFGLSAAFALLTLAALARRAPALRAAAAARSPLLAALTFPFVISAVAASAYAAVAAEAGPSGVAAAAYAWAWSLAAIAAAAVILVDALFVRLLLARLS